MAYGNGGAQGQGRGSYSNSKPVAAKPTVAAPVVAAASEEKRVFTEDPNELGIGYEKPLPNGGTYIVFKVTKDIPAGTKISVFANDKVKVRTDTTPTHRLKKSLANKA